MSVVPESDLPELLPWLRNALPKSFKIYGDLRSIVAGKWSGSEFVVDKWPSPTAVVEIPDTRPDAKCWRKEFFTENTVLGVYAESDQALAELLKTPGVITWNTQARITCVSSPFCSVITKSAEKDGEKTLSENDNWLLRATPEDVKPLPVPDGMKLVPVTEDMVDTVNATWKFASKGSDMFIRAMVQQFPSAALLTESGQHVGHMVGEHYGPMGMLYVQPEFRGQGLAKVIITNLAQKYFDLGEDAYVIVETTNEKSLKLHQSVGFKVVPDMVAWLGCGPQNSEPSD